MPVRALMMVVLGTLFYPVTAGAEDQWFSLPGGEGLGQGKRIVLLAGDEEYRSEETMPQFAKMLNQHFGFQCTTLFSVDADTGVINPNNQKNIPGLQALATADLMIVNLRFRNLPDDQMAHIASFLASGRPVIGLRTATHAFKISGDSQFAKFSFDSKNPDYTQGFGRQVLGETWISHHGKHGGQSTRGLVVAEQASHPILRGIKDGDIWGPTDVYGVRLPLPDDSVPLMLGQVVDGMKPEDPPAQTKQNDPMMPIAWTKTYLSESQKRGRVFTTTMGSSTDFQNAGLRRLLTNAVFWSLGLEDKITADLKVDLVGQFVASPFKPNGFIKNVKPSDFAKTTVAP